MPQTPFDARGYELYFHWCNGTGRTLDYTEGLWGDYMSDNNYIRFYLIEEAYYDALDMKLSNKETLIKGGSEEFNFEIENGYFSGYEMLHGAHFFKLISTHGVLNLTDNTYKFTFKLRWKDTINPNARQGDTETAKLVKKLNANMPKDYDIIIKWSQEIIIDIDSQGEIIMPEEVNYKARGKRSR